MQSFSPLYHSQRSNSMANRQEATRRMLESAGVVPRVLQAFSLIGRALIGMMVAGGIYEGHQVHSDGETQYRRQIHVCVARTTRFRFQPFRHIAQAQSILTGTSESSFGTTHALLIALGVRRGS